MRTITTFVLLLLCVATAVAGAPIDVSFTAQCDGSTERYAVVLPEAFDAERPADVLVALHGHGSDRWQFATGDLPEARALRDAAAEHQMIYVSPDYRAKTSWMGPKAEADMLQILDELRAKFKVRRVVVAGASMGGSSALTFAALHPDRIDGVISMNGTANHVEYENFQNAIAQSFGGTKAEVPDEYRRRSAELWPERLTMPIAATVGGRDTSVPPASVRRLMAELARRGRPVLLIDRPEGGHSTNYDDARATAEFVIGKLCAVDDASVEYLSTPEWRAQMVVVQQFGTLGLNSAVVTPAGKAAPLRIKDKDYDRGLGHHAKGEIFVPIEGQYKTFECEVGVQWQQGGPAASVVFQVFVDQRKVFESPVLHENDPAQTVRVSVEGADNLRLVATDAGDGINCDCANWAMARLVPDPVAKAKPKLPPVDIAPFARVVTSDPRRMKGTAAGRAEEFPAEDVFLDTEMLPSPEGGYAVPVTPDAPGCIGLRWEEARALRSIALAWPAGAARPAADRVEAQYWVGDSPWQGDWKPLPATCDASGDRWSWTITEPIRSTHVRWVFPASKQPARVQSLCAFSHSTWRIADVRVERPSAPASPPVAIEVYNGLLGSADAEPGATTLSWDQRQPLDLRVIFSRTQPYKGDRTVLRFMLSEQPIAVAVEDVVKNGRVFVPGAGLVLCVASSDADGGVEQCLKDAAERKTVLERVREMPDQTFAQALAKTHNPTQNLGPMMISLAADNRKFVVHRDGIVSFFSANAPDEDYPSVSMIGWDPAANDCRQLAPRFGSGKNERLERHLDRGWLPAPVTRVDDSGIAYAQRTFVAPVDAQPADGSPAWLRDRAVCVAEYTITNTLDREAEASLSLTLSLNAKHNQRAAMEAVEGGFMAADGDRLVAWFDTSAVAPLATRAEGGEVQFIGKLPAGGSARVVVFLPAWKPAPGDCVATFGNHDWAAELAAYWNDVLAEAIQIDLPDTRLAHVIRASQVHCMLAARNHERGRYLAAWVASDRYGPLESESEAVIRGMDMTGCRDFARRGLDFHLARYHQRGYLTTGYTLVGTGEHLWTSAEHFRRWGDRAWLDRAAPTLLRGCQWIVEQRAKTKRLDPRGQKVPEYGLMPPGVSADWARYAYRFYNDSQYCLGLASVADALASINHPEAEALRVEADEYRDDVLRAYRWTQSRMPVVPLANGHWVPNHPSMLDIFGNVEQMIPEGDFGRTWCYSIELGSHHLAVNGQIDPRSADADAMMDYLEDYHFLRPGMGDYLSEEKNHEDFFNLGGFSKVQPYYSRNAELCALRDDVKPFIRSYFNAAAAMVSLENLSFWEHFHNIAAWNKTHETGWFLCQSAMLFLMERDDELWLAPFVPNDWLANGKRVSVRNAPSRFGPAAYHIDSRVGQGYIEAMVEPPTRTPPARIVLRIRHPNGQPMKSVAVDGRPHDDFDPAREIVRLKPSTTPIRIRVEY